MKELVFLLEERSAQALLETLLPRFLCSEIQPRYIPFEGKQDLEKQLTKRIRAYQNPKARFVILRDQDSHPDCVALKRNLLALCANAGKLPVCLVRIACRELESFYLADLEAVKKAFDIERLMPNQSSRKFRAPDHLESPSRELRKLTWKRYQKISGSRAIGAHLDLNNQRSPSFCNLIRGIRRMEAELMHLHDSV
jgi:hypothetical protein